MYENHAISQGTPNPLGKKDDRQNPTHQMGANEERHIPGTANVVMQAHKPKIPTSVPRSQRKASEARTKDEHTSKTMSGRMAGHGGVASASATSASTF